MAARLGEVLFWAGIILTTHWLFGKLFRTKQKTVEKHASGGNDVSHDAHLVADRCGRSRCRRVLSERRRRSDPEAHNRAFPDRRFRSGHKIIYTKQTPGGDDGIQVRENSVVRSRCE